MVASAARTLQALVKTMTTLADPSNTTRRNTRHKCIVRHIMCHHCTCSNQCAASDIVATDNGAIGSKRGTFFHHCFGVHTMCGEMSPWRGDIGEDTTWTAKDIVLQLHSLIYRNIVLYTNTVANLDIIAYINILPQRAVGTNAGASLNMAEMPHLGVFANDHIVIDIAAFMYKRFTHNCLSFYYHLLTVTPSPAKQTERLSVQ